MQTFLILALLQDLQVLLSDVDAHNVVLGMGLMNSRLFQYNNSPTCLVLLRGNALNILLCSVENGIKLNMNLSVLFYPATCQCPSACLDPSYLLGLVA